MSQLSSRMLDDVNAESWETLNMVWADNQQRSRLLLNSYVMFGIVTITGTPHFA